jgi:hypothetical protein
MLVDVLLGESPSGGSCPVAAVVISAKGARDQSVECAEAKPRLAGVILVSSDKGGEPVGGL